MQKNVAFHQGLRYLQDKIGPQRKKYNMSTKMWYSSVFGLLSYYFIICILPEVKILALLLQEMISISIYACFQILLIFSLFIVLLYLVIELKLMKYCLNYL